MALYGNDWLLRACVALVCCRILLYSEDEVKVQLKPCLLMQKRDPRTERGPAECLDFSRGGWTRPRDVYGIIAFQSTGLRECMGKAVLFSAQFH